MDEAERLCRAADAAAKGKPVKLPDVALDWSAAMGRMQHDMDILQHTVDGLEDFAVAMSRAGEGFNGALEAIQTEQVRLRQDYLSLDWKVSKILSALEPEKFPDPGPPPECGRPEASHPQEEIQESTDQQDG